MKDSSQHSGGDDLGAEQSLPLPRLSTNLPKKPLHGVQFAVRDLAFDREKASVSEAGANVGLWSTEIELSGERADRDLIRPMDTPSSEWSEPCSFDQGPHCSLLISTLIAPASRTYGFNCP
jgi:hypothetical protein